MVSLIRPMKPCPCSASFLQMLSLCSGQNWICVIIVTELLASPRGATEYPLSPCYYISPNPPVTEVLEVLLISVYRFGWSFVGEGHWEDMAAGPRHSEAPHPLSILEIYVLLTIPIVGATSRMQPWESKVLLRPSGLNIWLNPVKASIYTFKILVGRCRDLFILWPPKTSFVNKFPCLLTLPLTNLEWSAFFFFWSLLALHVWGSVSDINQEISDFVNQHLFITFQRYP